jgi:hypothetical protein
MVDPNWTAGSMRVHRLADRRCIHKALRVTAIWLTPLPIALAEPGPATRALPTETVNSGKVGLPPSWRQAGFPV